MGLAVRSLHNLIRNPVRTILIVIILALSIGLALIMMNISSATGNQLASISEQLGTEIQIRPAGSFGLMGGGEPLNLKDIDRLDDLDHVVSVQQSAQTQYTGTSLQSSIEMGSLGRRSAGGNSAGSGFTMPIITVGYDPSVENPLLLGGGRVEIVSGRYFSEVENDADVVIVGQALADYNSLRIDSTIDINGASVEIIGIFTSGQVFGDNMLVMPISAVQRLFDIDGATSVTVEVDDTGNTETVVDSIELVFGPDTVDITTSEDTYEMISSTLESTTNTSRIGTISALIIAAVVILFAVAMMVRQRVKEIGILKAIGASNWHIGLQFATESFLISVMAVVLGTLLSLPLAQTVADMLVSPSGSVMGGSRGAMGRAMFGGGGGTIAGIDVAVSPEIFLFALGIAVALAIIASVFPSWYIARIKPAEVLRNE